MSKLTDLTAITTPDDADLSMIVDVSDTTMDATGTNKKLTWANAKATLKTYFDTLYAGTLTSDQNYVTDAQLIVIGNTSGTNTGDNATNSQYSGLAASKEDVANKSTTTTLGTSNTLYPTQNAVKTYVDNMVAGLLDYRGAYDASGNVFPSTGGSGTAGAVLKGDMWVISVAGTLGGTAVQIGDSLIANVDTPGQTAGNWNILNGNISYVPEDVANKSTDGTFAANSTTLYPSQSAVKTYADAKVADAINNGTTTIAPSQNAVFDALALKAELAGSTGQAFSASQFEVGNTDTTITRSAAGVIAVEGVVIPTISSTNTITNKRNQARTASSTTSSNLSPDLSTANIYFRTTQTATLTIDAPTGTPVAGEVITIYVDSASAQTLTINATYKAFGAAFPATTTAGKTFMMTAMYSGSSWLCTWSNMV